MATYLMISHDISSMASIDLKSASGLPLKLAGGKLVLGKGAVGQPVDIRTGERMRAVLQSPDAEAPGEFYYMHRDVHMKKDEKKIRAANLRYDITILSPFAVGDEYNKTFGHYHPKVPGTGTWYPEVYEVLHGHAHYLLQNGDATEFLVYDARAGDKCVMLPGFGHITVNPSLKENLVMANWVYPGFSSDYGPIEAKRGAEWYETVSGFVPNTNYEKSNPVKIITARDFP